MADRNAQASTHLLRDVCLERGGVLREVTTAYRTLGRLNAESTNVVLVLHGYTTGPSMLDRGANVAEGSWADLVGPTRAIDTDRWYVICPNMLGSSYGSTGPGSINPDTGQLYGVDFPRLTMRDVVRVQRALLDHLGVKRLAAAVGPSMGGYQALQWGVSYPEMVDRVVAAVSAPFDPLVSGRRDGVLRRLQQDPAWNNGHYAAGALVDTLTEMRVETLLFYGVDAELRARWPDPQARSGEIRRLARQWAEGFDPGSLLTLADAVDGFDLRPQLSRLRMPLLWVLSRTDAGFPPSLVPQVTPLLDAAGVNWQYLELNSELGHLASGADAALWSDDLRRFMETGPGGLPA